MRKSSTVLSITLALLLISVFPYLSSGEAKENMIRESNETLPPTRWTDQNTNLVIEPGLDGQIGYTENFSSLEDIAFTFEKNSLQPFYSLPGTYHTTQDIGNGNIIVDHGPYTFVATVISGPGGAWFSFWLSRYDNRLDRWDQSLEIHNVSGYTSVGCELAIVGDQLFYGFYLISSTGPESRIFVKQVDADSWISMIDTVPMRLDRTGHISKGGKFLTVDNRLLVFWIRDDTNEGYMVSYSNLDWTDPFKILLEAKDMVPVIREGVSGSEVVMVYRKNVNDDLNVTVSGNGGLSWSLPTQQSISFPGSDVQMTSTSHDGIVNLLIINRNSGQYDVFRSEDGRNFVDVEFSGDLGATDQLDGKFQGQITSDRSQVVLAFESQDRNIKLFHSTDNGISYSPFSTVGSNAWCPSFDQNKNYLVYSQGSEMMIQRFTTSTSGSMRTEPIYPIGISSWEDFGFQIDGFGSGSSLEFRILFEDGTTQLFPESGYIDVLSLGNGTIDGILYDHKGPFSGDWSSIDTGLDGPIILEVISTRSSEDLPAILEICLNFTNSFPIHYEMTETMHVVFMDNVTAVPTGVQLNDYRSLGTFIVGPIEKEEQWCDLIRLSLSSFSQKISVRVGVRDSTMGTIPQFTTSDCLIARNTSSDNFIRWGTRYLKDLPVTVDSIYLEFLVEAEEPTSRLTVESFDLLYSTDPEIDEILLDHTTIQRGGRTQLHITVSDNEEPSELLLVQTLIKDPLTEEWSDSMVEGQVWATDHWIVPIQSKYSDELGTYEISITVIDSMGDLFTSSEILTFDMTNNRPVAPAIYLIPDRPTTGDELGVELFRDGTDLETDLSELTYNFRFYRDGSLFREELNTTSHHLLVDEGIIKEGELWEIAVTTWDGTEESLPFISSITIFNTPPDKLDHPENITIQEDTVSQGYDFLSWFNDIDEEELDVEFSISEGLNFDTTNGTLTVVPDADFHGEGLLSVVASDEQTGARINIRIIVVPVNDLPLIETLNETSANQGEWMEYTIRSSDPSDGEHVEVEHDLATVIPGVKAGVNYMELPNGSFRLFATNDMVGRHTITVTASDGTATVNASFEINILNINDAPLRPMIEVQGHGSIISADETITLVAVGNDPDIPWGDVLSYSWTSSISGILGSTETLQIELEPGVHTITLEITDSSFETNSTTIVIDVLAVAPESKEVMDTPTFLLLIGAIFLILGLLIALIIFFLIKKKRKDKEEEKKEGEEDKKEDSEEKKEDQAPKDEGEKGGEEKKDDKGDQKPPEDQQDKNGSEPTKEGGEKNE